MAVPLVSVVIPTRGRPALLRRCLGALLRQEYPGDRLEIVVVEDGGPAGADRVVAEARAGAGPVALRYAAVPQGGPAAARNAGLRLARGEVIAFTDDDTLPAPGWIDAGVGAIAAGADLVSGRTVVPIPDRPTDYQRNVRGLERAEFATCNAFCRRDLLDAVGGFDPRFTRAYREDADLQFRVLDAGAQLVRAPAAVVVHPAPPGRPLISLALQRNQFFDALLYREHPRRFRERIRARPPWRYYAIAGAQLLSLVAAVAGRRRLAGGAVAIWLPLVGAFCARRLRGARLSPGHVADMLVTSALIPPVAVYWRLRGAAAFRVCFL